MRLSPYPVGSVNEYPEPSEIDGLALVAVSFTDPQQVKEYFGADLLSKGILPVLIVAENRSDSSSFALTRDRLSLEGNNTAMDANLLLEASGLAKAGASSPAWMIFLFAAGPIGAALYVLIAPILFTAGAKGISDAAEARYSFAKKALNDETLSPGGSTHGFVYFEAPEVVPGTTSWNLRSEVLTLRTQEWRTHELAIDSGTKP